MKVTRFAAMKATRFAVTAAAVAALAACAKPGNYEWGSYDQSLYEYYKDSQSVDKLTAELERLAVVYEIDNTPELGEMLTRASSEDAATRRQGVVAAARAIKSVEAGSLSRLAPGMLAELGYLYLEAGNPDKAVRLFRREQRYWPESAYFMEVMIRAARGPAKPRDGDKAAIEAEAARPGKEARP